MHLGGTEAGARRHLPDELGIVAALVVIVVVIGGLAPRFLTISNLFDVLLNTSVIALLAMGEAYVLLIGEIDLSVGSIVSLSGVLVALVLQDTSSLPVAVVIALSGSGMVGLANGLLTTYTRIPSFIVTFATLGVAASIPLLITNDNPIQTTSAAFNSIGEVAVAGVIPIPVFVVVGFVLLLGMLLRFGRFGLRVYAVGANRQAARLAGLRVHRVYVQCFLISSLLAGVAGITEAGQLFAGYPTAGSGNELFDAIAGAVVGGVSLFGGVGTIEGAFIGAMIVGALSDGLDVLNVSSYWQQLVIGVVIVGTLATGEARGLLLPVRRALAAGLGKRQRTSEMKVGGLVPEEFAGKSVTSCTDVSALPGKGREDEAWGLEREI